MVPEDRNERNELVDMPLDLPGSDIGVRTMVRPDRIKVCNAAPGLAFYYWFDLVVR